LRPTVGSARSPARLWTLDAADHGARERAPSTTSIGVANIIYSSEAWHHDAC
jgi:hypothetical protein